MAVRSRIYTGFVGLAVINPTLFCVMILLGASIVPRYYVAGILLFQGCPAIHSVHPRIFYVANSGAIVVFLLLLWNIDA